VYEIAIINPRPKRRRKAGKKSGARVMAKKRKRARKMSALQRKYFGKRAARRAPARRRRAAGGKRRPAVGYVVGSRPVRRRKMNPRRRRASARRRRYSNPRFSLGGITSQLMPAVFGAGGALALDVALGYIPLPAMLKTGYARHATRIVGAIGLGWAARKFLGSKGAAAGAGALTVAVYGLLKDVAVQATAGKVKGLGDYEEVEVSGYYDPAPQIGAYMPSPGMGAYMSGVESYSGDGMSGFDY
jgi:hypothetical protein